jgi:mannosyltransferase OCH1-like enzyme
MTIPSFDNIMGLSYAFDAKDYNSNPVWVTLKELYTKNYLHACPVSDVKIPRKIHQIWLGGKLPKRYIGFSDSWQDKNPDWEYRLWTDKDVDEVEMPRRDLFNKIDNNGQRSDFLRYHILNKFGGLYIDTDFECLKSFNSLSYLDFYTSIGYHDSPELYIGLIATIPSHPIIEHVISCMDKVKTGSWQNIFETTGNYFFTRKFLEMVDRNTEGVVAFPMDFFYPLANNIRGTDRPYDYVKDFSFAIHHWAVSWAK